MSLRLKDLLAEIEEGKQYASRKLHAPVAELKVFDYIASLANTLTIELEAMEARINELAEKTASKTSGSPKASSNRRGDDQS